MGAGVLQQQPLDHQDLTTRHDSRFAVDPQLHQQLAAIRFGVDAHGLADRSRQIDLDGGMSKTPHPELVEKTQTLQQQLDPVLRKVGQKPGSLGRFRHHPDEILLGQPPVEVARFRGQIGGIEFAAEPPKSSQDHLVVVRRLDRPCR